MHERDFARVSLDQGIDLEGIGQGQISSVKKGFRAVPRVNAMAFP